MPYYSREIIDKIRDIDLLTYLENYEPNELVKLNERMYSTREHDSLKISNGMWCWWSRRIGGKSALDFLIKVRGMKFVDAVSLLLNKTAIQPPIYSKPLAVPKAKKLILPEKATDNSRLALYLQKDRGIDEKIVEYCIKNNLIYEGLYKSEKTDKVFRNAIFVGYDSSGQAKYAAYRSLNKSRYMGDCSGSTKEYSFRLGANKDSNELHLFECAIDVLSFATLLKMKGHNWKDYNLISLSGVYQPKEQIEESRVPIALANYLKENPNINTVKLHLDNDYTGRMATKALQVILPKNIKVIDKPVKYGKDVNDFLLIEKGILKPFKYDWRNEKNVKKKVYALLVEPNNKPKITELEEDDKAIKEIVGGEYDSIYYPDDEVAILYNKNGVKDGHTLNRVIRKTEINEQNMSYTELKTLFRKAENEGKHIVGYITFTEDSFDKKYPLGARTYAVSSNNKAFQSGMGGYSIYGSSVDNSDPFVRLERYMKDEHGGADGWRIERCYTREVTPLVDMIVADSFLVCYVPNEKYTVEDIPQELVDKYFKEFEKPDNFFRKANGEIAVIKENRKPKDDIER